MNSFVVFAVVLTCAAASPGHTGFPLTSVYSGAPALTYSAGPALSYAAPISYSSPVITYAAAPAIVAPAFTKTQYHAQDELGQASHGYAYPGQAAAAVRDAAGNERGSYAYVNNEGQEIRVDYTAGHGGFQVASNALPVAPPLPVDTPEVAIAKAQHFAAVDEARARNAAADATDLAEGVVLSRKKRGAVFAAPLSYATAYQYTAVPVASSYSYRYDAPRVKTYVTAPIVKTIAPAPIVQTYVPAPIVKTYVPAPIVKTIAPAPIIRTIAPAPLIKTYAPAIRTYNYVQAPLKTFGYSPYYSSYTPYSSYAPYYGGYGHGYPRYFG